MRVRVSAQKGVLLRFHSEAVLRGNLSNGVLFPFSVQGDRTGPSSLMSVPLMFFCHH
jgi:hypothetical protein